MTNIPTFLPWTVTVIILIIWIWRERSWSSHSQAKDVKISELYEYNQNLLLQLNIEVQTKQDLFQLFEQEALTADNNPGETSVQAIDPSVSTCSSACSVNITRFEAICQQYNHTNSMVLHRINNISQHFLPMEIKEKTNVPSARFFDLAGLTYFACIFSLIMYEYYSIYGFSVDIDPEVSQLDKEIFWRTRSFLAKHHPLTNFVFFLFLIVVGSLSWLGVFSQRDLIALFLLKLTLSFAAASMCSFVASNFLRLMKYLPKDRENWMKSLQDLTWWHWFLSRCFGVYDLAGGLSTILWFAALVWYHWPARYFFYYLHISFEQNPALYVYILNSIVQSSILLVLVYYFYCVVILQPLIIGMKQMPETDEEMNQKNFVDRFFYRYIKSILENQFLHLLVFANNDRSIAVLIFVSLMNTLLYFIRLLYFLYTNKCTWYAWMITWMWLHIHIGLSVFALPCINFLMQEVKLMHKTKASFVDQFVSIAKEKIAEDIKQNLEKEGDVSKSDTEIQNIDEEELRNAAEGIFDGSLSKSVLFCLFVDTKKDEEGQQKKKEGEEEESRLATIFTAMLQTEAYAMGTKFNQQQQQDGEQYKDSTHQTKEENGGQESDDKSEEEEEEQESSDENDDGFVLEEVD